MRPGSEYSEQPDLNHPLRSQANSPNLRNVDTQINQTPIMSSGPGDVSRITINQRNRFTFRANVFNTRAQLFEIFFRRVALSYARVFPSTARRIIEFGFLVQAVFVLAVLIHLHITFVKSPVTCLDHLRSELAVTKPDSLSENHGKGVENVELINESYGGSWPRFGILRVEVVRSPKSGYSLADSYAKEYMDSEFDYRHVVDDDQPILDNEELASISSKTQIQSQYQILKYAKNLVPNSKQLWNYISSMPYTIYNCAGESLSFVLDFISFRKRTDQGTSTEQNTKHSLQTNTPNSLFNKLVTALFFGFDNFLVQFYRELPNRMYGFSGPVHPDDSYIIEYALEYGFLRLSPQMRKRLNITVKLILLDPETNPCFGNLFIRFLMEEFLGYEDLLLGSIKYLSVTEGVKGYVGNVITGQHYQLVVSQMSRSSYLAAALIMLLFTFCVSILLRYSSQQLVIVIADILQLFESNVPFSLPVAPFMTVILALVAMETILSEFFGDSITAFYVILIVSICDHYEAVFCRTELSRRYWPRFFYLYHFAFYAYHYRFNGQFNGVALWVSWLFILHSMIYFFHHYELPNLLSDWEVREFFTNIHPNDQLIGRFQLQFPTPWLTNLQFEAGNMESPQVTTRSSSTASPIDDDYQGTNESGDHVQNDAQSVVSMSSQSSSHCNVTQHLNTVVAEFKAIQSSGPAGAPIDENVD